ncbi:MAG: phosphoribosylanthranilate isomerase [Zoogloeaceae bacterium]|jgi:phosphoribosylanthranilate isomerase|nr:phosphoribosylanthranilate isomerase [Zoogloeaceae bacterium]
MTRIDAICSRAGIAPRIKMCGFTRAEDVDAAVAVGADALGFVFYPQSPRHVTTEVAARLVRRLPPFVLAVGLFVNAKEREIEAVLASVPLNLLQFHGDETPEDCARWQCPWIRAARVRPGLDLIRYAEAFSGARALLLDSFSKTAYGGSGKSFDWALIPPALPLPIILSGGLDAENVGEAIQRVRPAAVDVSSGVEAKGIKDAARMVAFVRAVRAV